MDTKPTMGDHVKIVYPDGTVGSVVWSVKKFNLNGNCTVWYKGELALVGLGNLIVVDPPEDCTCGYCKEAISQAESDAYDLSTCHK